VTAGNQCVKHVTLNDPYVRVKFCMRHVTLNDPYVNACIDQVGKRISGTRVHSHCSGIGGDCSWW